MAAEPHEVHKTGATLSNVSMQDAVTCTCASVAASRWLPGAGHGSRRSKQHGRWRGSCVLLHNQGSSAALVVLHGLGSTSLGLKIFKTTHLVCAHPMAQRTHQTGPRGAQSLTPRHCESAYHRGEAGADRQKKAWMQPGGRHRQQLQQLQQAAHGRNNASQTTQNCFSRSDRVLKLNLSTRSSCRRQYSRLQEVGETCWAHM